jgi:hypothetical protein
MKEEMYLKQLKLDIPREIKLDGQTKWMNNFLEELNEEVDEADRASRTDLMEIYFDGELLLRHQDRLGEYVLFDGHLFASFLTNCVRTGEVMNDKIDCQISLVLLDEDIKDRFSLADEVDYDIEGENRDLYFYEHGRFAFAEIIRENLFLNKNPYPKIEG